MPTALGVRQLTAGAKLLRDFQNAPDIPRPNILQQQIPVVGSAWQAAGDLQDENYGGALVNSLLTAAELTPAMPVVRGVKAAKLGITVTKKGSVTADAARKAMRRAGFAKPGEEIHHTIPLNGASRNAQNWRNHYALLKPLPVEQHRRLTGSWGNKPRYDPVRRIWYGTNDWQKAVPTGLLGYTISSAENTQRATPGRVSPPPPAARAAPATSTSVQSRRSR